MSNSDKTYFMKINHYNVLIIFFNVWRDMKNIASKKASKLRNERHRTGNFHITAHVQGSVNCPDSTPEEEVYSFVVVHLVVHFCF